MKMIDYNELAAVFFSLTAMTSLQVGDLLLELVTLLHEDGFVLWNLSQPLSYLKKLKLYLTQLISCER